MFIVLALGFGGVILSFPLFFVFSSSSEQTPDIDFLYSNNAKIIQIEREKVEQSILTVCETLKAMRMLSGCWSGSFSEAMGFLRQGSVYSGTLSVLETYPRATSFSCANADAYGRYLLFNALSSFSVQHFGYDVSPVGMDPCGVGDFVYWRG